MVFGLVFCTFVIIHPTANSANETYSHERKASDRRCFSVDVYEMRWWPHTGNTIRFWSHNRHHTKSRDKPSNFKWTTERWWARANGKPNDTYSKHYSSEHRTKWNTEYMNSHAFQRNTRRFLHHNGRFGAYNDGQALTTKYIPWIENRMTSRHNVYNGNCNLVWVSFRRVCMCVSQLFTLENDSFSVTL